MFGALSSAVNSALATLAPDVPLIQDFRHQWQQFLQYYTGKAIPNYRSQPVERTHQVYHLNNMMKLLLQEQEQLEMVRSSEPSGGGNSTSWSDRDISTDTISKQANSARRDTLSNTFPQESIAQVQVLTRLGPCMEFVIERQILDILSTLCQADIPPGLRPHIIRVFIFFMTHIKQTILPYIGVYLPIRRLLALCSVVKASPTESEELVFITALVTHLRRCPDLLTLFAHQPNPGDASHSNSLASSRASSIADLSSELAKMISRPPDMDLLPRGYNSHHILISAVLNYVDSADDIVSSKAMNCLQVVCGFDDDSAAFNAVHGTTLCSVVTERLELLYGAIHKKLSCPGELRINWMESHHHLEREDFDGRNELVAFFAWLDFCDDTINKSHATIADALAFAIREGFFEKILEDDLYENPEQAMSRLSQCWNHIHSEGLAQQLACWLFGDTGGPDLKNAVMHPLKDHLINQCLSDDKDLAIETLAFFNNLLDRPCQPVLQSLFTNNLETRGYYLNSSAESHFTTWSDEEDEREKQQALASSNRRSGPAMISSSRTLAPSNISRIVNLWLSLVPDSLRSTAIDAESSGYEQYVRNAQAQLPVVMRKCQGFEWPMEAISPDERSETCNSDSSSKPEADAQSFFEGQFLSAILDLVETLLDRDYDVNLEVTALCAKLAYLPHPYTHEFLLNPTIPLSSGCRNLFTALQTAIERGLISTQSMGHVQEKIYACKKSLLGAQGSERSRLNLPTNQAQVIDALIVLEEFCKELAAITLAKFHFST